ncbi:hypothetical protein VFPPC_17487 [Pochonia chlamydosporia 170]|uniref:Uncharacterized protein n=1 Tax=Pochonia chlamydosporia 170 TaxID=1380566 RepID=A0A219ARG2_METCM|nr:hypothetical protein VFPPC_17487 [Pochonia chlamydosporia 170]OWT43350.1 hypothetical protein VFPPC_17487 [Pochonia chlamydosporia 170]
MCVTWLSTGYMAPHQYSNQYIKVRVWLADSGQGKVVVLKDIILITFMSSARVRLAGIVLSSNKTNTCRHSSSCPGARKQSHAFQITHAHHNIEGNESNNLQARNLNQCGLSRFVSEC